MNTVPAVQNNDTGALLEQVVINADLSKLKAHDRVAYYNAVCKSLGLNPLTQPFSYIYLNGKLTLYARRDATDQLRKVHGVAVEEMTEILRGDIIIVTCRVKDSRGRTDVSKGAVSVAGLRGEALANAIMKAETKAKRRATLSIVGLGWADESEVETIPDAQLDVNPETGEITDDTVEEEEEEELAPEKSPEELIKPPPAAQEEWADPHSIPVGEDNWAVWGDKLLEHINRAGSLRAVNDWLIANNRALASMERTDLGEYSAVRLAVELRRRQLGGSGEKR